MAAPTKYTTKVVRASYVHLVEPNAFKDEPAKFSVTLLMPKGGEDHKALVKLIEEVYEDNKADKFKGIKLTSPKFKYPLGDGDDYADEKEEEGKDADAYRGMVFLKVASKSRPIMFDKNKNEILDPSEIYSGCYIRATIAPFAFNWEKTSQGISFFLNAVMFIKDGESLGGVTATADDFDDLDDDDDLF